MKRARTRISMTAATVFLAATTARASHPLYSMEQLYNATGVPDPAGTRPDDFHANGGGTTVAQDTIGATDQAHSLKFSQVGGQTFSGAITELLPDHLNDDKSAITMDITIPSNGQFNGSFARLGISEFGSNPSATGVQVQTNTSNEANIALAPGTYHIGVPLIAISNPFTFESNVSFFSVFGPDPNTQLTPGDWEIYVNKSSDSALTVYVDNIKSITLILGDDNFDGKVNALDFNILATNFGGAGSLAKGDFNNDGQINTDDFTILAGHFNQAAPAPALGALAPEPIMGGIIAFAAVGCRRRARI